MTIKAGYCTPMLHVADVARSLEFYARLGFETKRTEAEDGQLYWARVQSEGGALMFNRAEEPVNPAEQAVVFYLYTPDLAGLREQLVASGVEVSPIRYPDYLPNGEIALTDPDGYAVYVVQWGEAEAEAWARRLAERSASGRSGTP